MNDALVGALIGQMCVTGGGSPSIRSGSFPTLASMAITERRVEAAFKAYLVERGWDVTTVNDDYADLIAKRGAELLVAELKGPHQVGGRGHRHRLWPAPAPDGPDARDPPLRLGCPGNA
jgi:hypothetical protein